MTRRPLPMFLLSFAAIATAIAQPVQPPTPAKPDPPANTTTEPYGPLAFNVKTGGDFYISQDGRFVKAELVDGVIRFHLKNKPFQIGANVEETNIALTLKQEDEITVDGHGYSASRLSAPMTAAAYPNGDVLYVYGGENWSDGNNLLREGRSRTGVPLYQYKHAFEIRTLSFYHRDDLAFEHFKGKLYGFICVYREPVRRNSFIMPIELDFE